MRQEIAAATVDEGRLGDVNRVVPACLAIQLTLFMYNCMSQVSNTSLIHCTAINIMLHGYIHSTISLSILPVAYAVLQAEDQWQGSILVAALFGLDTLCRLGTTRTEPARAIGEDRRKVRRLNGGTSMSTKSYKQVRQQHVIQVDSQARTSTKSRWSTLWLLNALVAVYMCEHLVAALPSSTRDAAYAR